MHRITAPQGPVNTADKLEAVAIALLRNRRMLERAAENRNPDSSFRFGELEVTVSRNVSCRGAIYDVEMGSESAGVNARFSIAEDPEAADPEDGLTAAIKRQSGGTHDLLNVLSGAFGKEHAAS